MIILKEMNGPQSGKVTQSPLVEIRIGRDPGADLVFDKDAFPTVSRIHATIRFDGHWYRIDDDDSRHGTWVNGQRLGGLTYLKHGDVIQLGGGSGPKVKVRFKYDRKTAVTASGPDTPTAKPGLYGIPWVWVIVFSVFGVITLAFAVALLSMMN